MAQTVAGVGVFAEVPDSETERLRAECAALAEVLDEFTHEYSEHPQRPGWCRCALRADHVEHRTAAWVRRRLAWSAA
jgi:hypothetical protein